MKSVTDAQFGPPEYPSWAAFVEQVPLPVVLGWCAAKAKTANRSRRKSGPPDESVTRDDVLVVMESAQGRCRHCGSLAVERRPSASDGSPRPWEPVGRRIGSLDHLESRLLGGSNLPENLAWSCLWCNVYEDQRTAGALDHGGHHPSSSEWLPFPDPDRASRVATARTRPARSSQSDTYADDLEEDDSFYYRESPREIREH